MIAEVTRQKNIQNQLFIASCYNGIRVNLAKPENPINQKTHSNLKNLQLLLKYSRLCCWSELWYVYLFPNSGCVPILAEFRFWLFTILDAFFFVFCFYDATYRMKTWNWLFTRRLILCWKSPRPDSWEIYNNKI